MCRSLQRCDTRKQEEKWHQELNSIMSVTFWDKCWSLVHSLKNNNVIKYHQYQIVRGMLKTNSVVSHFIPLVTDSCSFGCEHRERISDLYWDCPIINNFWKELSNKFLVYLRLPFNFTKLNILFGIHDQPMDSVENTIILIAKRFIWKEKFSNSRPNYNAFVGYLMYHLETMKMISVIKNKEVDFDGQWGNIVELLRQRGDNEQDRPAERGE